MAVVLFTCAASFAWGSVSISPSSPIDFSYSGLVTLTASVSSGATADIDLFFDLNQNGSIDSGEPVWWHYTVTDGQTLPPAGAELVTDTDGAANGTIHVPILNMSTGKKDKIAGHFIARVKSGSSTSQAAFVINPPSAVQSISGLLELNGIGAAGVVMLMGSSGDPSMIVLTDALGRYTIPIETPDTYMVGGLILGVANDIGGTGVQVTVAAGQAKTGVTINVTNPLYHLKGQVLRADNNQPVPYAWVGLKEDDIGYEANVVADASGNYDATVLNGVWRLKYDDGAKTGFAGVAFSNKATTVTINNSNISGKNILLTPVAAFVTAKARNAKTLAALPGALLVASPPGSYDWTGMAYSDQNGNIALGLPAGSWDIRGQVDEGSPLADTMLYPTTTYSKTIVAGGGVQNLGNLDFMPADGSVTVKLVDQNKTPLSGVQVAGGGMGANNDYQGMSFTSDSSGNVKVLTRNGIPWFVFFSQDNLPYPAPPPLRMDYVAAMKNVITVYPQGYRKRPYRVYGGNTLPSDLNYPQDSGFQLLGGSTGTATFAGNYLYYCVVAYDGDVLVDSIRGSDGKYYTPSASSNVLNLGGIAGKQDSQYATVGDNGGQPAVGAIYIGPHNLSGLSVIHPDEHFNAISGWGLYGDGK